MDCTKWTSGKCLRIAGLAIATLTVGAIISHFSRNHTQTALQQTLAKTPSNVIVPLPADKAPKTVAPNQPHAQTSTITKTLRFKSTVIHHSLAQAEKSAGLPINLEHELNTMFANSSVAHDIHPGDRLEVLYHEYFVNDQANHSGNIVAAEITHGQNHYRMVRFTAPNHETGYYKANGEGTKPKFLKLPLHYKRIGSRFNYHRYDPVLHRVRPHLGVDFDAPKGTPVKAIGDGIVVMCKQMRGYGNVLMIRYNQTYKTLYAHLEKFAGHIKVNEHVKKGQVVGYVGMTGWSTGPHLHFSLFKNGVAINPLTVQFPHGSSLPEKYRQAFFYKRDHWFSEMNLFENAALANNKDAHLKHQS